MVDFKELVTTMSIGLRGTASEKMERKSQHPRYLTFSSYI
jgi:hypothetical protein